MSILIEAEKVRRKLQKLDAKRDAAIQAAKDKCEQSRVEVLSGVDAVVLAILQASQNLTEESE